MNKQDIFWGLFVFGLFLLAFGPILIPVIVEHIGEWKRKDTTKCIDIDKTQEEKNEQNRWQHESVACQRKG